MNAISAAHFSDPIHTVDELESFLNYHFDAQYTAVKTWFPHSVESLGYLIAVIRSMVFFYDCALNVICCLLDGKARMVSSPISRSIAALLMFQSYAEIFHRPTGHSAVFR